MNMLASVFADAPSVPFNIGAMDIGIAFFDIDSNSH